MDPFDQFIQLAGWPKDLDLIGRERLLSLWTFSCQPATELRASVFGKLTSVLSSQQAQDWEEKEWMDVVLAIRSGSADEKVQLVEVMCRRYVNRKPEVLDRLITALYKTETYGSSSSADPQAERSPNLGPEPSTANSVTRNLTSATPNRPNDLQPGAGSDNLCGPATEAAPDSTVTATGGEVPLDVGAVLTDDPVIEMEDSGEARRSTTQKAATVDAQLNNSISLPTAPEAALDSSVVTATGGEVRLGVGAVSTDDLVNEVQYNDSDNPSPSTSRKAATAGAASDIDVQLNNSSSLPTAGKPRSNSGIRSNKRKIAESPVSERDTKSPRLHLKQYSGVVQLSVSDIQGTTTTTRWDDDGCIKIDTKKWEAIMRNCHSSAKIILPEGSFFFPPKYDFRPSRPGVTISGTSPEKTTICYHPPPGASSAKPKKLTTAVILFLWNQLTLENLSFKAKFPLENFWPRVVIFGDKCQVQNVTFYGCGLSIESNRNVVENLKLFGEVETPAVSKLPTRDLADGIYIWTPGSSGNIVKNIHIQDLYYGIWKVNTNPRAKPKPGMADRIENVNCRNVKFGVNFMRCKGATAKNLTWQWDWEVKEEIRTDIPAAVQIHGGQGNEVNGITCQGSGKHFYGFVLNDEEESGVPKKNKISCVKGASGYWDNGEETELFDVEGLTVTID